MNTASMFIYVGLITLAAAALVVLILKTSRKLRTLKQITILSIGLVSAGILLGDLQWLSFGLMVTGILLVFFQIIKINKLKSR